MIVDLQTALDRIHPPDLEMILSALPTHQKVSYCNLHFESIIDLITTRVSVCLMTAKQDVR